MGRNVVSAKLDIIFKKIFSENEDLLYDFVASVLDIPVKRIKRIVIINSEMPPETINDKFCRLDLNLEVDDDLVNVEIQIYFDKYYRDRSLFNWAKMFTSGLKSGNEYGDLKRTITVNIVNFNMFKDKNYHHSVSAIVDNTGEVFSDKLKIHFFELRKVSKKLNTNDRKELWMQFIKADSEEEFDMLNRTNVPAIQKAVKVIYDLSEDTKIREAARLREKALHDEATLLAGAREEGLKKGRREGREEGRKEGLEEGRKEEREEIISKMRASGLSDEQIGKILNS